MRIKTDWQTTRFAQANVFADSAARWSRSHQIDVDRWRNITEWNPGHLEDRRLESLSFSMGFSARCAWGAALISEAVRVLKNEDLSYFVPLAVLHVAGKANMASAERMTRGYIRSDFRRLLRRAVKMGHVEVEGKSRGLNVYSLTEAGEKSLRFWLTHVEDTRDSLLALIVNRDHETAIEEQAERMAASFKAEEVDGLPEYTGPVTVID